MDKIGKSLPNMEKYKGFIKLRYTPTPDDLFDLFLPDLSGAELKIVMYIVRRTYGFKKTSDSISVSQITTGIRTKDGRQLDRGTGLTKKTALKAIKTLEEKGLIAVKRVKTEDGYNEVNVYSLRFRE